MCLQIYEQKGHDKSLFPNFSSMDYLPYISWKMIKIKKGIHVPGDSMWSFYIPLGGHLTFKRVIFNHPKKVTIAELPGR